MKHFKRLLVWGMIALFFLFIALAVREQSADLLYAASVLPIVIIPMLPDMRTAQWIKPSLKKKGFLIYATAPDRSSTPDFVVIQFRPGLIHWNKHRLYFPVEHLQTVVQTAQDAASAAVPVLAYDLTLHRNKRWVGIHLRNLVKRNKGFSFTLREVNRLVIQYRDIQELYKGSSNSVRVAPGKGMQA